MKNWTRLAAAMFVCCIAAVSCSKGGEDPFLKIESQTTFSVAAENASGEIKISSNVAWTISGATGWCTPEVTSGSGSRTVALTIADNDTRNPRSATLTVASSQGKYAINVSQEGNMNLNFYEEGSYKAVEINRQSNAVNIVIMGDGFILDDLTDGGAYDQALDRAREAFFDIEPFRSYRDHFNVYYVYAESKQRGGDLWVWLRRFDPSELRFGGAQYGFQRGFYPGGKFHRNFVRLPEGVQLRSPGSRDETRCRHRIG